MLLATLLLATAPNAVSISGGGGVVLSIDDGSYEGSYLSGAYLGVARVQYDRTFGPGFFAGGLASYERVVSAKEFTPYPPTADVGLLGGVVGIRRGDVVQGGVRLAAGVGGGFGAIGDRSFASPGWFIDVEGEISYRGRGQDWGVFLDVPILLSRTFYFVESDRYRNKWWYSVPIIPFAGTVGVRRVF